MLLAARLAPDIFCRRLLRSYGLLRYFRRERGEADNAGAGYA